jgi:peptidoglycan/LPS O-acetylase OafA/YrhL
MEQITIASAIYANPIARGFEFCLGISTWVVWDRYVKGARFSTTTWTVIEGAALVVTSAWIYWCVAPVGDSITNLILHALFNENGSSWIFAILIAAIASGRGWFGKALSRKPFIFLGHISFSIYMLHQILMKMFFTWNQAQTVAPLAFLAVLLFIASATYIMIEAPAQRLLTKRRAPATVHQAGGEKVHSSPELMADHR